MKKLLPLLLMLGTFAAAQSYYPNLDENSAWKSCGTCGNSAGSTAKAVYSLVPQSSLSRDGSAFAFSITPSQQYANGFEYLQLGANDAVTHFVYEFDILIPAQYASAPQGIEFQVQQDIAGVVYNMAWQAEWRNKVWRTYDYSLKKWETTQIPVNPNLADGNWHHIKVVSHRDAVNAYDDSLTVDGVVYPVNMIHPSVLRYSTSSHALNVALQLDTTSALTAYSVLFDKITLTAN